MRKILRSTTAVFGVFLSIVLVFGLFFNSQTPNIYYVVGKDEIKLNSSFSGFVTLSNKESTVEANNNNTASDYEIQMNLFGLIPLKTAEVKTRDRQYVSPCGSPFGIKLYTQGVIVVGMTDVDGENGAVNPAKVAGIEIGDCIMKIGESEVKTTEDVAKIFEACNGNALNVSLKRNDKPLNVSFTPILSASQNKYKAGLWVRDSSAGIGTLTFYNPTTGVYGGLGHAICDVDTGKIMPLSSGDIVSATITACTPSVNGTPGELCGYFHNESPLGDVCINGETGLFGVAKKPLSDNALIPVALKQEIEEGFAQIICTVDEGLPGYYDIEIVKICYNSDSKQKNMVIKVTDEDLIATTGGIVQGMSGSPIIQNNQLVGAVTHVIVNNAVQGYGIFAENMIETAENIE